MADKIASSAFYVAADIWAYKKQNGWGLVKVYGAFQEILSFVEDLLIPAPTRCFYEIIREGRPCKAYFDLEAEGGVLTAEQGLSMCNRVIAEWSDIVRTRWPAAISECPKCLEPIVLDGSRTTANGWKVSFHLICPYLTFPRNDTVLKAAAIALSELPQLCFRDAKGTDCRFVDTAVYTRNRQFRLPLNHTLSDETRSVLRLPGPPTVSAFSLACVTCLKSEAWRVPDTAGPQRLVHRCISRGDSAAGIAATRTQYKLNGACSAGSNIVSALLTLLHNAGQPDGTLQLKEGDVHTATFRWATNVPRRCCTAQIWRPADPTHDKNGAYVSYDRSRAVFLKCLHPQCLRYRGRGEFLGYVPKLFEITAVAAPATLQL